MYAVGRSIIREKIFEDPGTCENSVLQTIRLIHVNVTRHEVRHILELFLALNHISYELQALDRESLHVPLSITASSLHFSRHSLAPIPRNSERHISWCAVSGRTTCWPSGSTFADGIRAPQCLTRMLCKPGDYFRRGAFVVLNVLGRPACECDP
jgi:hypothetical protein